MLCCICERGIDDDGSICVDCLAKELGLDLKDDDMPQKPEEIRDSVLWEYERYGVKLTNINEEFDYIAFGHVEPRRFAAAFNAYAREFLHDDYILEDVDLADFDSLKYEWGEFWFNDEGWYFTEVAASSPFAVPYTRFF